MSVKNHEIADRLKTIRELMDISIDKIADSLSMTNDEYLQYETGEIDLPVSILYEVCKVLKISMTELLTGERARLKKYSLIRAGKGLNVERHAAYKYQNLAYGFASRKIEPLLVTVSPAEEITELHLDKHSGHEFHYCIEGSFIIRIDDKELTINEGDSLYFDSGYLHGMKALGGKEAKILVIVM